MGKVPKALARPRRTLQEMIGLCLDPKTQTEDVLGYLEQVDRRLKDLLQRVSFLIAMTDGTIGRDAEVQYLARTILPRYALPQLTENMKSYDWGFNDEAVGKCLAFYGASICNSEVPPRETKSIHSFLDAVGHALGRNEARYLQFHDLHLLAVAVTRHLEWIKANREVACMPALFARISDEELRWAHWHELPRASRQERDISDAQEISDLLYNGTASSFDEDCEIIARECEYVVYRMENPEKVAVAETILMLMAQFKAFQDELFDFIGSHKAMSAE